MSYRTLIFRSVTRPISSVCFCRNFRQGDRSVMKLPRRKWRTAGVPRHDPVDMPVELIEDPVGDSRRVMRRLSRDFRESRSYS